MKSYINLSLILVILVFTHCEKTNKTADTQKMFVQVNSPSLTGTRFKDVIFNRSDIDSTTNIPYRNLSDFATGDTQKVILKLDFYEPKRSIDAYPMRPLIIWMHGGGFEVGDKKDERETCLRFATRGFTVANINYRLNNSLTSKRENKTITADELYITAYRAAQDAKFAIRFAKSNAANARVDTNKVFFAGLSAGAVTALNIAYIKDNKIAATTISPSVLNSLGNLDYGGVALNKTSRINGIIAFAGSILDINAIQSDDTIPAICLHSGKDNMLPIGCGDSVYHLLFNFCSGREVCKKLTLRNVKTAFKFYDSSVVPVPYTPNTYTHGGVVEPGNSNFLAETGLQFALDSLYSFFKLNQ